MKKILMVLASLLLSVAMLSVAEARSTTSGATTSAPPAVSAATRAADLADLVKVGDKKLSAKQAKALGLKEASSKQVARIKQLQKARTTKAAGTYYWYTWQNRGVSWADRYYTDPHYSYPWYPYYVIIDHWKTCTYSGTGCIDAHACTYQYLLYYYPNGTWYYYNTGGYQSSSTDPYGGFGPYAC